ncbi:GntR family transcriptional regulator [Escherichia coli]|nr:GntR family transcriptional regulator [Escherichia coli]
MLYTVTFNETERKEDIELSADVRAGDLLSLTLDGVKDDYTVGNDSNLLIVFYVQIMPDDFVMQLHRF